MPHYKGGEEAQPGDWVKGTGYNLKDALGRPLVLVGLVLGVKKGPSCNVTVGFLRQVPVEGELPHWEQWSPRGLLHSDHTDPDSPSRSILRAGVEYGQCDHFELVHRPA